MRVLTSADGSVQVDLRPVTAARPAAAPGVLDVGKVPAWPVGQGSEGGRLLRVYDMDAPSGPYRLRLRGSPGALESASDDLAELLVEVRWSG